MSLGCPDVVTQEDNFTWHHLLQRWLTSGNLPLQDSLMKYPYPQRSHSLQRCVWLLYLATVATPLHVPPQQQSKEQTLEYQQLLLALVIRWENTSYKPAISCMFLQSSVITSHPNRSPSVSRSFQGQATPSPWWQKPLSWITTAKGKALNAFLACSLPTYGTILL